MDPATPRNRGLNPHLIEHPPGSAEAPRQGMQGSFEIPQRRPGSQPAQAAFERVRAGLVNRTSAVDAEVVVIGIDGTRVGNRMIPEAQIVCGKPAVFGWRIGRFCAP